MQTTIPPVDYDALVRPIETAPTMNDARAAVWGALRAIRYRGNDWNAVHVIDAAAWCRGISERFRRHAVTAMLDESIWTLDGHGLLKDVPTAQEA
jgi:hypothetical protein